MSCALCLLPKTLRHSHVLSELIHRPVYDEKHTAGQFAYGDERPRLIQQGIRERLLCDDCEQLLGTHETYFSRYWYGGTHLPFEIPASGLLLRDLDYRSCKLFVLSLIWRASVAKDKAFSGVSLGPHEETIRRMLLTGEPGAPNQYCVHAGLLVDPSTGKLFDEFLYFPTRFRLNGVWAYRMVFGGASWTVTISSHQELFPLGLALRPDGQLLLPVASWKRFALGHGLRDAVRNLRWPGMPNPALNPTAANSARVVR